MAGVILGLSDQSATMRVRSPRSVWLFEFGGSTPRGGNEEACRDNSFSSIGPPTNGAF